MNIQLALRLPRDAATVAVVRGVAVDSLARLGVTEECIEEVRLALSEACTNVIDHAHATDEYEVRLDVDETRCVVTVTDTGTGTGLAADGSGASSPMPEDTAERGRGLAIMRALVDAIDFRSVPEAGTVVRLEKTLKVNPGSPLDKLARS